MLKVFDLLPGLLPLLPDPASNLDWVALVLVVVVVVVEAVGKTSYT